MNKKVNPVKIVKIPLATPLNSANESDNEIELKSPQQPQVPPTPQAPPVASVAIPTIKPKKKINISDEERERRRQSMLQTREKKMSKTHDRRQQQEQLLKMYEAETHMKLLKKTEQLRKKQEKSTLQKILQEELNNNSNINEPSKSNFDATSNLRRFDETYQQQQQPTRQLPPQPQPQQVFRQSFTWV